ncbi:hypothetical protein AAHZ94_14870 [Streptomyces sp. HSW2009]|uniref:hypothetical protein n=1 Tax=Streptomyces sp. HSW2009 TaxID=3142890 RepID=UPI0032EF1B80
MDDDKPEVRDMDEVQSRSLGLSRELLQIIDLKGDLKQPATAVGTCGERDDDKFYRIHSAWSLAGPPIAELEKAMVRLKEQLPGRGWDISTYGPARTKSQQLSLVADFREDKFSVNVELLEPSPNGRKRALLYVSLASACFEVPEGKSAKYEY